jgi:tetratricopeptide (TPR) repeat protein
MTAQDYENYVKHGAKVFLDSLPEMISQCLGSCNDEKMLYFVSELCVDLERYNEAIDVLNKLQAEFGLNDVGHNLKGFCYDEIGRVDLALMEYAASLKKNPNNTSSLRNAAYIESMSNEKLGFDWARLFYEKFPQDEDSGVWYSVALWNNDRRSEAIDLIDKLKALCPKNEKVLEYEAELKEAMASDRQEGR